jgi:hypothetical protein
VRALAAGLIVLVLEACASSAAPAPSATQDVATVQSVATLSARFDPTAAVGGGSNASGAVTADQLKTIFGGVQPAAQLNISANASPPGATGSAVTSVSINATDSSGVLKGMDAAARHAMADALLTAAGAAWPQASISMLLSDPGSRTTMVGTRPPGGPNTVIP